MPWEQLWRRHDALTALTTRWRRILAGRSVKQVITGPGWLGLALGDRDRKFLFLMARTGTTLLWEGTEPLPRAVQTSLGVHKNSPITSLIHHCKFMNAGMFPKDRIVALIFRPTTPVIPSTAATPVTSATPTDSATLTTATDSANSVGPQDLILLHQLFGPRGNLVLLDAIKGSSGLCTAPSILY